MSSPFLDVISGAFNAVDSWIRTAAQSPLHVALWQTFCVRSWVLWSRQILTSKWNCAISAVVRSSESFQSAQAKRCYTSIVLPAAIAAATRVSVIRKDLLCLQFNSAAISVWYEQLETSVFFFSADLHKVIRSICAGRWGREEEEEQIPSQSTSVDALSHGL